MRNTFIKLTREADFEPQNSPKRSVYILIFCTFCSSEVADWVISGPSTFQNLTGRHGGRGRYQPRCSQCTSSESEGLSYSGLEMIPEAIYPRGIPQEAPNHLSLYSYVILGHLDQFLKTHVLHIPRFLNTLLSRFSATPTLLGPVHFSSRKPYSVGPEFGIRPGFNPICLLGYPVGCLTPRSLSFPVCDMKSMLSTYSWATVKAW